MRRLVFSLILGLTAQPALAQELPALSADPARVSISGLSSGGFMAVQYSIAYSSEIMGVGVVAGGTYACTMPPYAFALLYVATCMHGDPSVSRSWASVQQFARAGTIDPPAKLRRQRVYLFSGAEDSVVAPSVMKALRSFYSAARVPSANIRFVDTMPAGHAFLSDAIGGSCGANGGHYIEQCAGPDGALYDQPGAILGWIYGALKPRAEAPSATPQPFAQGLYGGGAALMATTGYVYVPTPCRAARAGCGVHVVLHGCAQSAAKVGDDVYARLGYNRWADTNRIIMLYPQVDASALNPMGCWDWFAYSAIDFQQHLAPQMVAIRAMIARLEARP